MQPISFGGIPSPKDYRDIKLTAVLGAPQNLPKEYFVDIKNLPIWNQKSIGSCVGHAGAKYRQKQEETETKSILNLSPRFLYALAKCFDNYPGEGTYPRILMKAAKDYGCATEKTVPNNCDLSHEEYVFNRKLENIPSAAIKEAAKYKIKSYATAGLSCDELKQAIIAGQGCMLLVRVGREWWTDKNGKNSWKASDILPIRPPAQIVSGHEIWLYGYRTSEEGGFTKFYFLNSWSKDWADNGTGFFFYEQYKPFIDEAITAIDLPNELLDEVHNLPSEQEFKHHFYYDLKFGQNNDDVKKLQTALKIDGVFPVRQKETGYYGVITQKAVKAFQVKYKVASWWELNIVNGKKVGPATRFKLNSLFSK